MGRPAAKYRRISADREGRELGIERQDQDLDALGERRDLRWVGDYVDNDLSASTKSSRSRPGYQRLLADAKAGRFEVIAAYTTSRITRRPREFEDLIDLAVQHGIEFQYIRSPEFDLGTAQGRRIARTLAAQDAGESEEISERVTRAALQRAERGEPHGGLRPFGYHGTELDLAEAEAVRAAYRQLLAGVPVSSIARELTNAGVRTVTGQQFTYSTLSRLMCNPRNAGLRVHRGEVIGPAQWPAIVDESTWRAACALLTDPSRRTTTGNRASYLLSGIAICGGCGRAITSGGAKRSDTGSISWRRIYVCRANKCVGRRQDWIDSYVGDVVVERLSRPDARELLVDEQIPDLAAMRTEASALRVQLAEWDTDKSEGRVSRARWLEQTERISRRLDQLEAAQVHVSRAPVLADLVTADDVRAVWDALPLDRQRAVVDVLLAVTLHPGGAGKRVFDPSKVEIVWRTIG